MDSDYYSEDSLPNMNSPVKRMSKLNVSNPAENICHLLKDVTLKNLNPPKRANLEHIKPKNKELLGSLQQPLRSLRQSVEGTNSISIYRKQAVN
jgi:hypothetical protein